MDNYVARKSCGCMVGAVSKSWPAKEISVALAKWAKRGLSIESATDEQVRKQWVGGKCPHDEVQLSLG